MRLKIRCDGKCEKFCKIFWELNKALGRLEMKFFLMSHQIVSEECSELVLEIIKKTNYLAHQETTRQIY